MKENTEFEYSAGGIVKKGPDVLLIKTKDIGGVEIWTFPKGKIEKGETAEEAAIREVLEETGFLCSIDRTLDETRYLYVREKKLVIKRVVWFLMNSLKRTASC